MKKVTFHPPSTEKLGRKLPLLLERRIKTTGIVKPIFLEKFVEEKDYINSIVRIAGFSVNDRQIFPCRETANIIIIIIITIKLIVPFLFRAKQLATKFVLLQATLYV